MARAAGVESKAGSASRWKKAIEDAQKVEKAWRADAAKVVARYREEDNSDASDLPSQQGARFNILYANIAVLRPAVFQTAPRPDVRRRYDPPSENPDAEALRVAGRKASAVIEGALAYLIDAHDFETEALDAVSDMLLPGRGVLRIRYDPTVAAEPVVDPVSGEALLGEDGEPLMTERVVAQDVFAEYVYWQDFLTAPARRWSHTTQPPWIAFRHLWTKEEVKREFPRQAGKIPLTWESQRNAHADERQRLGEADRAEIWEVWELATRKVFWIAMGYPDVLDEVEDPLGLARFYPVPRPLVAVRTTDTLVPVAEYKVYVEQARELDLVTARISRLTSYLKATGVYNAALKSVEKMLEADDGTMVAADSFEVFQGGKVADHVVFWPVERIAQVLTGLYQQRDQIKQTIYEIIGISDILRGATKANETLGAQRIKAQFGALRIDERRREVDRVFRDALEIMAECIAAKFEPDVLARMTGVALDEASLSILRDEGLRGMIVDIETDSTVAPDEAAEQEAVTKLLTAVTQFIAAMTPVVQAGMLTGAQVIAILRFAIQPFRGARMLEEVLDEAERSMAALEAQGAPGEDQAGALEEQNAEIAAEIEKLRGQNIQAKGTLDLEKAKIDLVKTVLEGRNAAGAMALR